MTEQVLVPFDGEDSGVGELSWGQREIWLLMCDQRSSLSIGGTLPLAGGTTIDEITAGLSYLMGRHQSLRTRLELRDGMPPRQVLASSGKVALEIIDASGADAEQAASAVCSRFAGKDFDYEAEWPVRWAVVLRRGVPAYLVYVVCHLAADGYGAAAMLADLASYAQGSPAPAQGTQPLAQAGAQQALPSATAKAMRHWERLLRQIPARRFGHVPGRCRPRYWQLCYESPASHLAVRAVAVRTGASTSTVLLAAFAVTMSRLTGAHPAVVQVVVSNRFRPGLATSVSPVNQTGLCVIDVADITFDEAVARAWSATVAAYKFAYYDPRARDELIASVSAERGENVDVGCFLNDRRIASRQEPDGTEQPPDPAQLRDSLTQSTLTWGFRRDRPTGRCFMLIDDVPGMVFYEMVADTDYVSPADMEACVRGMETLTVAAALDPAASTGVTTRQR